MTGELLLPGLRSHRPNCYRAITPSSLITPDITQSSTIFSSGGNRLRVETDMSNTESVTTARGLEKCSAKHKIDSRKSETAEQGLSSDPLIGPGTSRWGNSRRAASPVCGTGEIGSAIGYAWHGMALHGTWELNINTKDVGDPRSLSCNEYRVDIIIVRTLGDTVLSSLRVYEANQDPVDDQGEWLPTYIRDLFLGRSISAFAFRPQHWMAKC